MTRRYLHFDNFVRSHQSLCTGNRRDISTYTEWLKYICWSIVVVILTCIPILSWPRKSVLVPFLCVRKGNLYTDSLVAFSLSFLPSPLSVYSNSESNSGSSGLLLERCRLCNLTALGVGFWVINRLFPESLQRHNYTLTESEWSILRLP